MANTHMNDIQRLQNRALWVILGVPQATRVYDLHLEANLPPLIVRYKVATAYQEEKYCCHSPNDPLYSLAHTPLSICLAQSTWQQTFDMVLLHLGIAPSQNPSFTPSINPPSPTTSSSFLPPH